MVEYPLALDLYPALLENHPQNLWTTDEARQISEEIHRRIFREERERRGSEGDQPRSTEPLTRETRLPGREMGGDPSAGRETGTGTEVSLLNIPPPSMADEPGP